VRFVFLGLSITSSWGNGHATNYRALVRELDRRGHDVLFLERDVPWYAEHRDLRSPPGGRTVLYSDVAELEAYEAKLREADLVVIGSYVRDGVVVGEWVTGTACGPVAFWDIDTPVTLAKLESNDHEYLSPDLLRRFELYLSFTGGPILDELEQTWGARRAEAFYCLVDVDSYYPGASAQPFLAGYLGTYSPDRQPHVDRLLFEPARRLAHHRFAVAGPQYPDDIDWPTNVERIEHLPPTEHRAFYLSQLFTVNVTRDAMRRWGWSPSVRLFEAAACRTPVVSDRWEGLDAFFEPGREILVADDAEDAYAFFASTPEAERLAIAERARSRVLAEHTPARRAEQLEGYVRELAGVAA
jgi:spore maturation protein CgeB